jgi:hypothetical protein
MVGTNPHFEMQMRSAHLAGVANSSDELSLMDLITDFDE